MGSFLERKIFYAICEKKIFGKVENRYINNFYKNLSLNKKQKIEKELDESDIFQLIQNNNYDYLNYDKKKLDDFENNKIENVCESYYIIPKNKTNKSFDSALLINCNYNENDKSFYLILFQITHHKKKSDIKNILDYTKDALSTKQYFENIYSILIEKVFFYYILSFEYKKEDTIKELNYNKISFIFFSYKQMIFINKNEEEIKLKYLFNGKDLKYDKEKNIYEKDDIINFIESKFIQRKRKNNFIYNYQSYELIRRELLEDNNYFYLKNEEKEKIIKILKKTNQYFSSKEITLIYNYYIDYSEFHILEYMNDVIGLFSYEGNILLTYKCQIYIIKSHNGFELNNEKEKILGKLFNEYLKGNKKK